MKNENVCIDMWMNMCIYNCQIETSSPSKSNVCVMATPLNRHMSFTFLEFFSNFLFLIHLIFFINYQSIILMLIVRLNIYSNDKVIKWLI